VSFGIIEKIPNNRRSWQRWFKYENVHGRRGAWQKRALDGDDNFIGCNDRKVNW
jgi:hypothetical protein